MQSMFNSHSIHHMLKVLDTLCLGTEPSRFELVRYHNTHTYKTLMSHRKCVI